MPDMALAREPRLPHKVRRTPELTARARQAFLDEWRVTGGWEPGGTIQRVAEETGLTLEQARDAIFAESADSWRRELVVPQARVVHEELEPALVIPDERAAPPTGGRTLWSLTSD